MCQSGPCLCLWPSRSNVSVYGERWLDAPAGSGPCHLLSVEIVSSVPPRAENKLKLLRVVAY